jgi:hypothetical protein
MKNICYDQSTYVIVGLSNTITYKLVNDIDDKANVTINKNAFMINCSSELKMLEVVVAISKSIDTSNVQQTTTKPELTSLLIIPNSKRSEDDKMIDQYLRRSQDYQDLQEDHEIMGTATPNTCKFELTPGQSFKPYEELSKFRPQISGVPTSSNPQVITQITNGPDDESDLRNRKEATETDVPTFPVKFAKNIHSYDSIDDINLKRMIDDYTDQDERIQVNYGYRYTHNKGPFIENNS